MITYKNEYLRLMKIGFFFLRDGNLQFVILSGVEGGNGQ